MGERPPGLAEVSDAGSPLLRVSATDFAYDSAPVLRDLACSWDGPGLSALVGPNGSGKSTLLRIAGGLIRGPNAGARVRGRDVGEMSPGERARWIAWVPQRAESVFAMTVREMIRVGRTRVQRPFRRFPAEEEARLEGALDDVGLLELADRDVDRLSGGEWQRGLIARALVQETPILLLDEPVASLDLRFQEEIYVLLAKLAAAGRLVIVADHHLELAAAHVSRILMLHEGRIARDGPAGEVLTAELVRRVFGVDVQVFSDPVTGSPRLSRPERP